MPVSKDTWIDDDTYVGLERRAGGSGLRIFDRRRRQGARTDPPSLATMIRQLKSASVGLHGHAQWARFQVRLEGAIGLAELQNHGVLALELARLLEAIRRAPAFSYPISQIDAHLDRALAGFE